MSCQNSTADRLAPQNIMVTNIDPASLRVSWEPPLDTNNLKITGYMIQYSKVGSQDKMSVSVANKTTLTISGLIACTEYSVTVAAMNDNGTGPFSEPVIQTSGGDSELNLNYANNMCYVLCHVIKSIITIMPSIKM